MVWPSSRRNDERLGSSHNAFGNMMFVHSEQQFELVRSNLLQAIFATHPFTMPQTKKAMKSIAAAPAPKAMKAMKMSRKAIFQFLISKNQVQTNKTQFSSKTVYDLFSNSEFTHRDLSL